jgi:RecB family exonuclease
MMQRFGLDLASSTSMLQQAALRLLPSDEGLAASVERTTTEVAEAAVELYRAMCGRTDVRALYAAGPRLHEVPFTASLNGVVVRGTIDCLIHTGPDEITILEFKTGQPRPEHQVQLDVYHQAAVRLFPGSSVDALLVYATAPGLV